MTWLAMLSIAQGSDISVPEWNWINLSESQNKGVQYGLICTSGTLDDYDFRHYFFPLLSGDGRCHAVWWAYQHLNAQHDLCFYRVATSWMTPAEAYLSMHWLRSEIFLEYLWFMPCVLVFTVEIVIEWSLPASVNTSLNREDQKT